MNYRSWQCSTCIAALLLGASLNLNAEESSDRLANLNGGYYLLYHLCDQESQLHLITLIKHTPPEVAAFADRISATAHQSAEELETLHREYPAVRVDKNPLPDVEIEVRKSIAQQKQHKLLMGTSNNAFVQALLVSQIESSSYAVNLAKVLSEQENDPKRIHTLKIIQARWQSILDEAYRRLQGS